MWNSGHKRLVVSHQRFKYSNTYNITHWCHFGSSTPTGPTHKWTKTIAQKVQEDRRNGAYCSGKERWENKLERVKLMFVSYNMYCLWSVRYISVSIHTTVSPDYHRLVSPDYHRLAWWPSHFDVFFTFTGLEQLGIRDDDSDTSSTHNSQGSSVDNTIKDAQPVSIYM